MVVLNFSTTEQRAVVLVFIVEKYSLREICDLSGLLRVPSDKGRTQNSWARKKQETPIILFNANAHLHEKLCRQAAARF